jgi:hypothetical protein
MLGAIVSSFPSRADFFQKPFVAAIGIVLKRWDCQSMGDSDPPVGVYPGRPHCERERGAVGRWRARRQRRPLHCLVRSHSPYLGGEWGAFAQSLYSGVREA